MEPTRQDERPRWLDRPRNVDRIFWTLCAVCAAFALADLFYDKHGHFWWEDWFNFNGWYGFVCCFLLVLAAKELRKVLMRDENYYD